MSKYTNIYVDIGASFTEVVYLDNNDGSNYVLTNYVARARARKHIQSTSFVEFGTAIDLTASTITLTLTSEQTTLLDPVNYIFDLIISNNVTGSVIKVVEGTMIVTSTMSI